jgi:hypothetical protein
VHYRDNKKVARCSNVNLKLLKLYSKQMTTEAFRLLFCYTASSGEYVRRGVSWGRIAFICRVLLDCLTLENEGTMQLVPGYAVAHSVEVALQAGRSRVRSPMGLLGFFIYIIPPEALSPWGRFRKVYQ